MEVDYITLQYELELTVINLHLQHKAEHVPTDLQEKEKERKRTREAKLCLLLVHFKAAVPQKCAFI